MRTCSACQLNYPDEMDFCPRDATPLPPPKAETLFDLSAGLSRKYRIVRCIGEGGMGAVFLAEQLAVGNRQVALKLLHRKLLDDPGFLQRFEDEAASTGRIRHPNVVTVYECGQTDDGAPYIAMEYLEGESLRQTLKRRGPLPLDSVALILQQAARGLHAAHKLGIIHRDLKPDNILLTHDDEDRPVIKIVDFGIAKMRESSTHTQTGMTIGTPTYMSVEQAAGMRSGEMDGRSDVYSLGIVVYEMITGCLPFEADTPIGYLGKHLIEPPRPLRLARPELAISPEVEDAVMKALRKKREERYATTLDFAQEFAKAIRGPEAPAEPISTQPIYAAPPPGTFTSGKLILFSAVLLLILLAGAWYAFRTHPVSGRPAVPAPVVQQPSASIQSPAPASVPVEQPSQSASPSVPRQRPTPNPAAAAPDKTREITAALALGDLLYNRGEYDDAIAEYRKGLGAAPGNAALRDRISRCEKAKAAEQRLNQ